MTRKIALGLAGVSMICIISTLFFYNHNNVIIENEDSNKIINSNALTMMYETEAGSGEYQVSSDNAWPESGYTFNAELSKCENGSKLTWDEEDKKVLMQANTSDKCYVYFDKEPSLADLCSGKTFAECITTQVYTGADGENDLYYHDGTGSYTNADQEAGDNSYRYTGANPNNYVCFGSDEDTCPEDNLYRMIGVFDGQAKLIKHEYANSDLLGTNGDYSGSTYSNTSSSYYKGSKTTINRYYWNGLSSSGGTQTNIWSESRLNTVNLNTNYLDSLSSKSSSLIANHTWQVGGLAWSNVRGSVVKTAYTYEVGDSTTNTTYSAKIGLMYISDYGYAASPANWSTNMGSLNNDTNRNNNWMFMGLNEWVISPNSSDSATVFSIFSDGYVGDGCYSSNCSVFDYYAVRPVFYLSPWVLYSRGDGTKENPYRISAPENLISFTFADTTYYAEDGMTWEEWLNSDYNNGNFMKSGDDVKFQNGFVFKEGHQVKINEIIEKDTSYQFSHSGGGINF